ncbi:hypothetical protein AMATHDRAFT_160210 [Amanita thiersii Skay4041]|uniref:Uncharacterized protein n=1 Tax=Amanita thiersii Skay4041 TaxID=703135 RepID=A0A2A9N8J5_9AGAR|nr:hypothetical protein AMATHDRAFT_160210 [Amanita thiersii Skay4041]
MTSVLPSTVLSLPPPGFASIPIIKPILGILMEGLVGVAILVALLVTLLFFSTKQLRSKPIFIMNVISITLGLSMGIFCTLVLYQGLVDPPRLLASAQYTLPGYLSFIIPIFVESILLFRLFVVYPYRATPLRIFLTIFIPLGCIKVARVVNASLFISHLFAVNKAATNTIVAIQAGWTEGKVFAKVEWLLQVIDNTACSCLFLYKLNIPKILTNLQTVSNSDMIRVIFWISVSNFVFPVLLSIAQLIFVFHDTSFFHGVYMLIANDYVSIVGVLLAMVWSASGRWTEEHCSPAQRDNALSIIRFTHHVNVKRTTTATCSS